MSERENELRIRTGRIKDRGLRPGRAKSFFDTVVRAAKKAGHAGGRASRYGGHSTFGRGRAAYAKAALGNPSRRVIVKARIVRHRGTRFRSASLATHLSYLQRDGTDRDGHEGILFDADGEDIDGRSFATSCENDRHHFRFIVSPEDANQMRDLRGFTRDLRGFTRDLMHQAEKDLETRLEWAAVAHHNTDNPHVHILVRGIDEQGGDLVISRDYIGRGLRARAEALVSLELGPRSEREIDTSLAREVKGDRWTRLDHSLQLSADENAGVLDLRPADSQTTKRLQGHLLGRAQHLERLGLASPIGPAQWILEPDAERTLRDLGQRGDIIKTMHDALSRGGRAVSVSSFAIDGPEAPNIVGRLADRGLHDELTGSTYAIIEGVDGRAHHVRFASIDAAGDAPMGSIVEARTFEGRDGKDRMTLSTRSEWGLNEQVTAPGATWLDRQLVTRKPVELSRDGFGMEVRDALERRIDHLASQGLADRRTGEVKFARGLLKTLEQRELDAAGKRLSAETGLEYTKAKNGENMSGVYRRRLSLSSGRFAMIDNGLGFELVPWKPSMEKNLGREISGVKMASGGIDWKLGRSRGLDIG